MTEQDVLDAITDGLEAVAEQGTYPELGEIDHAALPTDNTATLLTLADGSQYVVTVVQIAEG